MAGEPKWTDKVSAFSALLSMLFALISSIALIVIAMAANDLQQEMKQLTFPEPDPVFSIPAEIPLPNGETSGAFYKNKISTNLSATGFSAQDIVVESISIQEIVFPDAEKFSSPIGSDGIDLQWDEENHFVIEPKQDGQFSAAIPLLIAAEFARSDYSIPMSEALPLQIDVTFQIDWFESQTMRPHTTTVESTIIVQ